MGFNEQFRGDHTRDLRAQLRMSIRKTSRTMEHPGPPGYCCALAQGIVSRTESSQRNLNTETNV